LRIFSIPSFICFSKSIFVSYKEDEGSKHTSPNTQKNVYDKQIKTSQQINVHVNFLRAFSIAAALTLLYCCSKRHFPVSSGIPIPHLPKLGLGSKL
jgi:hypothetical protein